MTLGLLTTPNVDFSLDRLDRLISAPHVLIRHDVDYDLDCAREMAAFEADRGVTSIYLVRTDGADYSVDDAAGFIEDIASFGHRIGLHPDLGFGRNEMVSDGEMLRACEQASAAASFDHQQLVSFHAPPTDLLWRPIDGWDHLMSDRWFGRYVSDSRGMFRRSPEEYIATGRVFQLNLHPEWWFLPGWDADRLREEEAVKP